MELKKKNYQYIRNFKVFENRVEIHDNNGKPFIVFPCLNMPRDSWLSFVALCIQILDDEVFNGLENYDKGIVPLVVNERHFKKDVGNEVKFFGTEFEEARRMFIDLFAEYGLDFSNVTF